MARKKIFWLVFTGILAAIVIIVLKTTGPVKVSFAERSRTIQSNELWSKEIYVTGDVTVPKNLTLFISPGTKVLVNADSNISFNIQGRLIAIGAFGKQIIFKSNSQDPKPTDWNGIFFGPTSSGKMKFCIIEWVQTGPILDQTENVIISNCAMRHISYGGLTASQNSPVFKENILSDIGGAAFSVNNASPVIKNNIISRAKTGFVFNTYDTDSKKTIVFKNNVIQDGENIGQLRENTKASIQNNIFTASKGMQLADNIEAEITNNIFSNLQELAINYTTGTPSKILIENNIIDGMNNKDYFEKVLSKIPNITIGDNSFR